MVKQLTSQHMIQEQVDQSWHTASQHPKGILKWDSITFSLYIDFLWSTITWLISSSNNSPMFIFWSFCKKHYIHIHQVSIPCDLELSDTTHGSPHLNGNTCVIVFPVVSTSVSPLNGHGYVNRRTEKREERHLSQCGGKKNSVLFILGFETNQFRRRSLKW